METMPMESIQATPGSTSGMEVPGIKSATTSTERLQETDLVTPSRYQKTAVASPLAASETTAMATSQAMCECFLTSDSTAAVTTAESATPTSTVVVTVTGTNDTPEISVIDVSGSVTEDQDTITSNGIEVLRDSGSIDFSDIDITDRSSAEAELVSVIDDLGDDITTLIPPEMTVAISNALTLTGDGVEAEAQAGTIQWQFELDNALTQQLATGEFILINYKITVSDGLASKIASGRMKASPLARTLKSKSQASTTRQACHLTVMEISTQKQSMNLMVD